MILSISNIAWDPEDRLEVYSLLQKYHFKGLEFAPGLLFNSSTNPFNPEHHEIKKVLQELNLFDLKVVSMQSLLFGKQNALLFGDPDERKFFFNSMLDVIKLAERLNVPNLVFGSPANRNIGKDISHDHAREIAYSTFQELGKIAANAGTSILMEPNPREYGTNFINTMHEAISFVKELNSPGIKSILDIGSLKMNDEFKELSSLISESIHYLNHVHISEPYLKPAPKLLDEYQDIYKMLHNFEYDKSLSIEMKSDDVSVYNIEDCLSKMSEYSRL